MEAESVAGDWCEWSKFHAFVEIEDSHCCYRWYDLRLALSPICHRPCSQPPVSVFLMLPLDQPHLLVRLSEVLGRCPWVTGLIISVAQLRDSPLGEAAPLLTSSASGLPGVEDGRKTRPIVREATC